MVSRAGIRIFHALVTLLDIHSRKLVMHIFYSIYSVRFCGRTKPETVQENLWLYGQVLLIYYFS